jgi:hypothetical protein
MTIDTLKDRLAKLSSAPSNLERDVKPKLRKIPREMTTFFRCLHPLSPEAVNSAGEIIRISRRVIFHLSRIARVIKATGKKRRARKLRRGWENIDIVIIHPTIFD